MSKTKKWFCLKLPCVCNNIKLLLAEGEKVTQGSTGDLIVKSNQSTSLPENSSHANLQLDVLDTSLLTIIFSQDSSF